MPPADVEAPIAFSASATPTDLTIVAPPNERVFVRVIPADDLVAARTVKVSLGPPP